MPVIFPANFEPGSACALAAIAWPSTMRADPALRHLETDAHGGEIVERGDRGRCW